jgi:hypothetical protein
MSLLVAGFATLGSGFLFYNGSKNFSKYCEQKKEDNKKRIRLVNGIMNIDDFLQTNNPNMSIVRFVSSSDQYEISLYEEESKSVIKPAIIYSIDEYDRLNTDLGVGVTKEKTFCHAKTFLKDFSFGIQSLLPKDEPEVLFQKATQTTFQCDGKDLASNMNRMFKMTNCLYSPYKNYQIVSKDLSNTKLYAFGSKINDNFQYTYIGDDENNVCAMVINKDSPANGYLAGSILMVTGGIALGFGAIAIAFDAK